MFAWAAAFLLCTVAVAEVHVDEKLIGWRGDTYKPHNFLNSNGSDIEDDCTQSCDRRPWIQTISWKPRAQIYHNFLSDAEARHILELARYQMRRSTVVGPNEESVVDSYRTSAGTFLKRNQDPVISAIEQRLAVWTQLPPAYQEDMQVLRYGPSNKYGPHLDGLDRVCTVLFYLVAPEEGGETTFTKSEWAHPAMTPDQSTLSACAKGNVAYKPKRGDALLFYDRQPDYTAEDYYSMHTACPVIKGFKWNAVKWMHGVPFREYEYKETVRHQPSADPDPGVCTDSSTNCKYLVENGECEKSPATMTGKGAEGGGTGICRKACHGCEECSAGDKACMNRNREASGYLVFEDSELYRAFPADP